MKKIVILTGLSLILIFLIACTRDIEVVLESQSIQPETGPIMPILKKVI